MDKQMQLMAQQLNDALALLGAKEMEITYLRKQIGQMQAAIKAAAEAPASEPAKVE